MIAFPKRGLYAITPQIETFHSSKRNLLKDVVATLRGGAQIIQYRDKSPDKSLKTGIELLAICHQFNVPLIINDDIELALQIKADGVHLGKDDGNLREARIRLGERAIIGISCYNSIERALEAEADGATYVAFGRFFPSSSKPLAAPAELATLQRARQEISLPIVAIGGILPENGAQLIAAGADMLAVIGGVFNHDPELSASAYLGLFQ